MNRIESKEIFTIPSSIAHEEIIGTITSGKASFSMFAMKGEDFPNLPDLASDKGFSISSEKIRLMISKVSHSIAEVDSRPMLCGGEGGGGIGL